MNVKKRQQERVASINNGHSGKQVGLDEWDEDYPTSERIEAIFVRENRSENQTTIWDF